MKSMTSRVPTPNETGAERLRRREQAREQAAADALAALHRANARVRGDSGVKERVEREAARLKALNVGQAIEVISAASDADRNILLLAEEAGKNRVSVREAFPPVTRTVRALYESETATLTATVGDPALD